MTEKRFEETECNVGGGFLDTLLQYQEEWVLHRERQWQRSQAMELVPNEQGTD